MIISYLSFLLHCKVLLLFLFFLLIYWIHVHYSLREGWKKKNLKSKKSKRKWMRKFRLVFCTLCLRLLKIPVLKVLFFFNTIKILFTGREGYPCARVTLASGLKSALLYKQISQEQCSVNLSSGSPLPLWLMCFFHILCKSKIWNKTWSSLWKTH